ncbi:hypothetical protein [uncultured Pseudomonas sp.]|uniref:hypothetical protein n=1 Tax=uncultured Pseudomonas sp. TaxID=114707 RepID=UPI0025D47FC9|nr:hypothetical protein [uncultured Pseudomonas sp.]
MANKTAQRLLRFLAGRFRDTQADGKVYALQNGTLLDVTSVTQKALSTVPLTVTSAGQTVFSVPGGYTPGLLQVARNGILQSFTGTDGSIITLSSGTVSTSDTVTAYVFATFQVANALMLSGGTMAGPLVSPGISMTGSLNQAPIVTLASAATVNIGAAAANTIQVTGTTTITAFDTVASGIRKTLRFSGSLTLTYDATKLILPRAANIVTVAGDSAEFVSLGSGNWACLDYSRASAAPARSDLGLGSAALMSTLGTAVSGGGSGAIIETGTTASGSYTRWADGTQQCKLLVETSLAFTNAFSPGYFAIYKWTFPAAFVGNPSITFTGKPQASICLPALGGDPGIAITTSAEVLPFAFSSMTTMTRLCLEASGRWYQ